MFVYLFIHKGDKIIIIIMVDDITDSHVFHNLKVESQMIVIVVLRDHQYYKYRLHANICCNMNSKLAACLRYMCCNRTAKFCNTNQVCYRFGNNIVPIYGLLSAILLQPQLHSQLHFCCENCCNLLQSLAKTTLYEHKETSCT